MRRRCAIPVPVSPGWSQAQLRDEYFRTLAEHQDCAAQLTPRSSRWELQQHEAKLRRIQGLLKGDQLDTLPFIPGSMAERESKLLHMAGMG